MSKENLEQFMTRVASSEDLQAKLGEEITADALVALGAAHGCEFSIEDLQASAELSDGELERVAGGVLADGAVRNKGSVTQSGRFTLSVKSPSNVVSITATASDNCATN
jgi:predicted ribosomally synthesized peptide with nif11-like leader